MIIDLDGGPAALLTRCPGPLSTTWQVTSRACIVAGLVLANLSGTVPARIALYDGAPTGGQLLGVFTVPAGTTLTYHGGDLGIAADGGLVLDVTAGTLTPSVTTVERT